MPKLSPTRRAGREASLVNAAREVFVAHGFEAASVAEIARRAGVSDGLLYRYFSDKRAILTAVLERFFEDLIDRTRERLASASGLKSKVRALAEAHLSIMAEEPDLCRLFLLEIRNSNSYRGSPLHALTQRYTAILVGIAYEARAAGELAPDVDTRMLRDLLFGGMEHIGWHFLSGGNRHDPHTTAERLATMLVGGIAAK
jgi:TetR/AcrR family transcriptional regulator, fatty acid metabolism regulator protein